MDYLDYTNWKIPTQEKEAIPLVMEKIRNNEHSVRASKNLSNLANYYLIAWKLSLEYLNLDFENPKIVDKLECFINDLRSGKLKKYVTKWVGEKGKEKLKRVAIGEYKDKKKYIQALRIYVSLRYETDNSDNIINPKFEEIQDKLLKKINKTKFYKEEKEVETLEEEEIEKLISETHSEFIARIETESIGGLREGEASSILMNGVRLADEKNPFVEIEITKSKTRTRKPKLYSKKSQERIKNFYDKRISENAKPTDKFFTKSHSAFRQHIKRLGRRVLNKNVYPHMFRASAVTNNIEKGLIKDESDMNSYYGWSFGTGTCRKYINKRKLTLKEVDKNARKKIFGDKPQPQRTIQDVEFEKKIEMEAFKKDLLKEVEEMLKNKKYVDVEEEDMTEKEVEIYLETNPTNKPINIANTKTASV